MSSEYLVSMVMMGALAVLVLLAAVRTRQWYHYSAGPDDGSQIGWTRDVEERPPLLERPIVWVAGFFGLMVLAVGGVFAFVTNPDAPGELLSMPVAAGGGLLVGAYLLYGIYSSAKGRGHPSSIAAAEVATVAGALFLVAVSVQLIG